MKKKTVIAVPQDHQGKANFRKVTVTLPPDIYERLIQECARRKIAREPNQMISALFREALIDYLGEPR
jgi:transcriptional regulator of met regulon